jgi:uncharacterized sulfatase
MMKKIIGFGLVVVSFVAAAAWLNRIEILLAVVKYQSQNSFEVAENSLIEWQQGPDHASGAAGDRSPNIILIVADDLGFNDISTFGGGVDDGRVTTPNIDQLAAQGAVFNQSYAGNATCAPSRAMLMTGRYPARTGFEFTPTPSGMAPILTMITSSINTGLPDVIFNESLDSAALPSEEQGLPSAEVTVAEMLKDGGYHTAHIGKWHLGRSAGFAPNDQGFDESLLMASGLYLPEDDANVVNAKLAFDPIDRFLWARFNYAASFNNGGDQRFKPAGYLTDYWTDESIKMIQANKNRPFFLYLAHWGVHTPLQATREDYEAVGDIKPHRQRVYAAMIRALDRSVGRIMETLEAEGLADNTLVMFTSDNGGAGYIGLEDINAPFRGWKLTNFEGGLRVPLFVKWPAKIAAGTLVDTPVAHIDVLPTVVAAAQMKVPGDIVIDGINLLPAITAPRVPLADRPLFWTSGHYRAVRQGDWKLQIAERPNKSWLYNLAVDPAEETNLAGRATQKQTELMALLEAHKLSSRKPLYPSVLEVPVAVDKPLSQPFGEGDDYVYWAN